MRKCIHGKVKPCWICKHDYDRAAPYVATNWQQEAEEWKAECHRVSGELESQLEQSQKMQLKHQQQAEIAVAKVAELAAENAGFQDIFKELIECGAVKTGFLGGRVGRALNPTSAGGLYDE